MAVTRLFGSPSSLVRCRKRNVPSVGAGVGGGSAAHAFEAGMRAAMQPIIMLRSNQRETSRMRTHPFYEQQFIRSSPASYQPATSVLPSGNRRDCTMLAEV